MTIILKGTKDHETLCIEYVCGFRDKIKSPYRTYLGSSPKNEICKMGIYKVNRKYDIDKEYSIYKTLVNSTLFLSLNQQIIMLYH